MPFSSGTFSRVHDFTDDRDNGIRIQASRMDAEMDGIATGLSTALLKDGTQTATATIPFAAGISIIDNQKITLGTNSDITLQYDETTNDSLEIAANVEGAALGIVLKSDQGDDNADQHKLTIADGGVLTLGSKISGSFVDYLTHTPNSTVASSTLAVAGNLTVGGNLTLGSGAVLSEAELEQLDGITAGTVTASKAVVVDANKDIASFRNITLTGELDAGSLDISGDADIDGTLEADAMTLNGSAITTVATLSTGISNGNLPVFTSGVTDDDFLRVNGTSIEGRSASEVLSDIGASAVAGSSSIVTTGALDSGSITSGFGAIDNGTSGIRTNTFTAETSFVPDAQDGASLGTSSLQFSDLFLADGAVTAYGDDGEVTLTHVHDTGLLLSDASGVGTTKLMFGDSGTFVHQESDGTLTVESDTTLKLKGGSVLIQGADGSAMGTFSQGGTAVLSFNNSARLSAVSAGIDVVGTVAATSLDISGDIDVDGTTNLDVVDIDGAVDMASTLTLAGNADFNGDFDVDGTTNLDNTDIDGTLNVQGETTLQTHLNMGDNDKIKLGDGGDLEIYHDGTHSYISDVGTGPLRITTDGTGILLNKSTTESMGRFLTDGAVELYHNDSKKIERTSSGIDVTGSISADGEIDCASSSALSTISATATGSCNLVLGTNFSGSTSQGMPNQTGFINMRQSFPIIFGTAETERLRIDQSGYLYVNTGGSEPSSSQVGVSIKGTQGQNFWKSANSGTGGYDHLVFFNGNGSVGSIFTNGSSTTYSTSSDYRLKESITYDFDATTRLKQLKPCRFNFIADANTTLDGFLAHEVSSIVPEAIKGEKDAMTEEVLYVDGDEIPDGKKVGDVKTASQIKPQGIDQSKLVPLLVKTIQELEARITALESA